MYTICLFGSVCYRSQASPTFKSSTANESSASSQPGLPNEVTKPGTLKLKATYKGKSEKLLIS